MEQLKLKEDAFKKVLDMFRDMLADIDDDSRPREQAEEDIAGETILEYLAHPEAVRLIIEQNVKELEWSFLPGLGMYFSQATKGRYIISGDGPNDNCNAIYDPKGESWERLLNAEPLAEAKAACQRHHAEQVLKLFNIGGENIEKAT